MLDGFPFIKVATQNYFGVLIDINLCYISHISVLCKKMVYYLYLIKEVYTCGHSEVIYTVTCAISLKLWCICLGKHHYLDWRRYFILLFMIEEILFVEKDWLAFYPEFIY